MAFRDLYEILPPLVLPISGKEYTVPFLGINDEEVIEAHIADRKSEPMSDEEFQRRLLGPVYNEMFADNVPYAALRLASLTALADHQRGRIVAQVLWESGNDNTKMPGVAERIAKEVLGEPAAASDAQEA